MRTLFWKIFLSFWAVVAASIVGSLFLRPDVPLPAWQNLVSSAFAIQAENLVQAYEKGGKPELDRVIQHLRQGSYDQVFLLDSAGRDLAGQHVTPQAKISLTAQPPAPRWNLIVWVATFCLQAAWYRKLVRTM